MSPATSLHIVLIARHYPPEVSGGARRPAGFVDAMRARGHRVTIVTPFEYDDPDHIPIYNAAIDRGYQSARTSPEAGVPRGGSVLRLKAALTATARRWAYWPDPNIGWAKSVAGSHAVRQLMPDVVMTTSPPESSHWAGLTLAEHWGVPWVAEFRDTWITNAHRAALNTSKLRRGLETRLARRWLRSVSAVIGVSEAVLADVRCLAPAGTREAEIGHFATPSRDDPSGITLPIDRINLVHSGGFSQSDPQRSLAALLNALSRSASSNLPLCLYLAGVFSSAERAVMAASDIEVRDQGQISLDESRQLQMSADALVLCVPDGSHAIPGKLAEYWQTQTPIIRFGHAAWVDSFPEGSLPALETSVGGLRKGVAVAARDDRFSLARAVDGYESLLRTVVQRL